MTFNAAAVQDLYSAVVSGSMSLGLFEQTRRHEPKGPPPPGLNCAVWVDTIKPLGQASGLDQTSGLVSFFVRVYNSMLAEPQDDIDPQLLTAVSALMAAYTGNFDFGHVASVRQIDLLGAYSSGMQAQAGYMEIGGKFYRVMVISLPIVCDNMFIQTAGVAA